MATAEHVLIVGGAGFIGSHFTDHLLADPAISGVTLFDNFSSGREWHYEHHLRDPRFAVVKADVKAGELLCEMMQGHELVIHLASNPDIARAATEPTIDFDEGTLLTQRVMEAMRLSGASQILYASGSGVYGDLGQHEVAEGFGPLAPVSTYGASKLAGEAMISAYCHMFGLRGAAFRFGNVVGPRQTHGVGFDFVRRLVVDPSRLSILGDGTQSKSYIHVDDVVRAVLVVAAMDATGFEVFNVATDDYITVSEIAALAVEVVGLDPGSVRFEYAGGDRGWKGDVPIVRLDTQRIRCAGWECELGSREALRRSMESMVTDARAGRL